MILEKLHEEGLSEDSIRSGERKFKKLQIHLLIKLII